MPRELMNRQLHHIQDEVLLLGSMVEQAMLGAVDALLQRNQVTANRIYRDDALINDKRFAIENAVLILIATQQPMAHDLRQLTAILEIITELERIGDYAKGIAKVTHRLGDHEVPMPAHEFEQMSEIAVGMLHRALGAFINENPNEAVVISQEDDQVDSLYEHAYRSIVEAMIANPVTIDQSNLLLWVAHNLERTADRVTNICERTVFISTGELLEMDSTDDELDTEEID